MLKKKMWPLRWTPFKTLYRFLNPYTTTTGDAIYVMDQLKDDRTSDDDWLTHVAIERGMDKLSEREQNIIKLRFFQGRTQMEVAEDDWHKSGSGIPP